MAILGIHVRGVQGLFGMSQRYMLLLVVLLFFIFFIGSGFKCVLFSAPGEMIQFDGRAYVSNGLVHPPTSHTHPTFKGVRSLSWSMVSVLPLSGVSSFNYVPSKWDTYMAYK